MKKNYLILISLDAVGMDDLELLKKFPNFSSLLKRGSLITEVDSVYPSLTYPAHVTMITGKYPKNHGVINNTKFEKNMNHSDWYWYRKYVKGETLYDLAKTQGIKTCSILWPVTARSKITYNMPEIFNTKKWHSQLWRSLTSGSLFYQLKMLKKFRGLKKGAFEPELDSFTTMVACETIKEYQPQLLMLHLLDLDIHKHYKGIENSNIEATIERSDQQLGKIIRSLEEANIYDQTTIAIMGDHSQLTVSKMIRLNALFLERNWLTVNRRGGVKHYDVCAKSCDGSTYIYLNNLSLKHEIRTELLQLEGVEHVFERDEIEQLGADITADFMVEAKEGYYFIDEIFGDLIEIVQESEIGRISHRLKGCHGYLPTKPNYQTFLLMSGPHIKKGYVTKGGAIINHAPTFAKILNIQLEQVDGKVQEDLFK